MVKGRVDGEEKRRLGRRKRRWWMKIMLQQLID